MVSTLSTSSHFNVDALDEDDGEGVCPKAFTGSDPLMISEVRVMLEHRAEMNEKEEDDIVVPQVFQKARQYCSRFGKFTTVAAIKRARAILEGSENLTKLEMAQLGNLCPDSVEEARRLIQTLDGPGKIDDDELRQILEDLKTTLRYQ